MKMMQTIKLSSAVMVLVVCLAHTPVRAAVYPVINVNLTGTSAQFLNGNTWITGTTTNAPLAYSGTVWTDRTNNVTPAGSAIFNVSNLPYSDGTSSGVGFNLGVGGINYDSNFQTGSDPIMTKGGTYDPLTLTLTDLTPGGLYNLYLVSSYNRFSTHYGGTFTIGSTSLTSTSNVSSASWQAGLNYVAFFNLTPDINNQIVVTSSVYPDSYSILNGFQLEAVPEPSSAMLLGVGGWLLWQRRSRR